MTSRFRYKGNDRKRFKRASAKLQSLLDRDVRLGQAGFPIFTDVQRTTHEQLIVLYQQKLTERIAFV